MKYWKSIKDENGNIYSCDMIRINFTYWEDVDEKKMQKYFNNINRADAEALPIMTAPLKYRYMYKIQHDTSNMVVGFHFNAMQKDGKHKGYVEFNPNKCMDKRCLDDLTFLQGLSKSFSVCRWDLAVDLPVKRNDCVLLKDARMYQLVMHSDEDKTEYLGQRSQVGYMKLYNKTIESSLDYDLTRLEITMGTLDNIEEQLNSYVPRLYLKPRIEDVDFGKMNDTTRLLIGFLRESDRKLEYLHQLNYRAREKIKPYILQEDTEFYCNTSYVKEIVSNISEVVKEKKIEKNVVSSDSSDNTSTTLPAQKTVINGVDITDMLVERERREKMARLQELNNKLEKATSETVRKSFEKQIQAYKEEHKKYVLEDLENGCNKLETVCK